MTFFQFIFSFLFVRNWYTGEHELSRPRLALFSAALFLILLGVAIVAILQMPVVYEAA